MGETENYKFDGFRLSIRTGPDGPPEIKLYFEDTPQILTQQESKTLEILVRNQGQYVETRTLAEKVCGVEQADETIIHGAIRGLRRIFRDPVKGGKYIENERKKGYRFIKTVEKVWDEGSGGKALTQVEVRAQAGRPVDEPPPIQGGDAVTAVAQSGAANVTPADVKDQVIGFDELWRPAGRLVRGVILGGIVATAAVSAAVIGGWEKATPYVSVPQLFMLLFAIAHGLPGPRGLREDFRKDAGYDDPGEGDDARHIAENALGRYRAYWRRILGSWLLLYVCLSFLEPGNTATDRNQILGVLTTLFNNLSTAMFVLCYNILNQPVEIKAGQRDIDDTAWRWWSFALVVAFFLVEIYTFKLFGNPGDRAEPLYALNLVSGIVGAIGMALYMGRLQSKFLGPSPGLVITLYTYTAIQPLFIFLVSVPEDKQVFEEATVTLIAVILINVALFLKCLLYLYIALLVKSGSLLFYFVKVRRTYLNVDRERQEFRKFLRWES